MLTAALGQPVPNIEKVKVVVKRQARTGGGVSPMLSKVAIAMLTDDDEAVVKAVHGVRSILRSIPVIYNHESRLILENWDAHWKVWEALRDHS